MSKPTVIERARIAWHVFKNGYPRSRPITSIEQKAVPFIWPAFRQGAAQWQIVNLDSYVREGFEQNTLVYSAVMYKVRAIGQPKLRAYSGDPDHPELLPPNHPLSKLVARPNPSMSWREFQGIQDAFLNLAGNCYTYLERPKRGGLPTAMYPMHPSRVYIVPSDRGVKGFLYVPEGKGVQDGVPLLPEDVSHVKLPNPGDPLEGNGYGLSPVSPMAHSADVDNMITKFLKEFFEQGAIIPGLLKFDVPLDDAVVSQIKERWKEMYGGYENWTEVGVMDRGGEYQKIGLNFKEMGFETQDERNETRILGPFGVPPILIGSRIGLARSTYSNYEEARRAFWEDTMSWEIGLFEDDYQYYLQSDDGGFVQFDLSSVPALRKDVPKLVIAFQQLVQTGVPKAMAAELVGLDLGELEDGDVIYMPNTLTALGEPKPGALLPGMPAPEPEAPPKKPSEDNEGAAEAEEDERETAKGSKAWNPEQKEGHWKAVDNLAKSWEKQFRDGAVEAFEHDKRQVLARLTGAKTKAIESKATIDWESFEQDVRKYLDGEGAENWRKVFIPLVKGIITAQGERWASELGVSFDVQNLFARDWFNKYMLQFAQPINDTTRDDVATIVDRAQAEGATIPQMQDQLTALFDRYAKGLTPEDPEFQWFTERLPAYRTELIARTETIRSSSAGSHELFSSWGVEKKEWLSTQDSRTRTHKDGPFDHLEANGEVVDIDKPFTKTGEAMMYPGDPSGSVANFVNCRCTLIPVVE